jgi:hypothetical protein
VLDFRDEPFHAPRERHVARHGNLFSMILAKSKHTRK